MKKKSNAKKEIIRDKRFEIRMSKEEKELFYKYAEDMQINPSRLARNILLKEAQSISSKILYKPTVKAYIKYLEITNQYDILETIKTN